MATSACSSGDSRGRQNDASMATTSAGSSGGSSGRQMTINGNNQDIRPRTTRKRKNSKRATGKRNKKKRRVDASATTTGAGSSRGSRGRRSSLRRRELRMRRSRRLAPDVRPDDLRISGGWGNSSGSNTVPVREASVAQSPPMPMFQPGIGLMDEVALARTAGIEMAWREMSQRTHDAIVQVGTSYNFASSISAIARPSTYRDNTSTPLYTAGHWVSAGQQHLADFRGNLLGNELEHDQDAEEFYPAWHGHDRVMDFVEFEEPMTELSERHDGSQMKNESCTICLEKIGDKQIGVPDRCDHVYCYDCLLKWIRRASTCPQDRTFAAHIKKFSKIGGLLCGHAFIRPNSLNGQFAGFPPE